MGGKIRFSYEKVDRLDTIESGLYKATKELLFAGVFNSMYLKDVTEELSRSGAYMLVNKDTVLLHARPSKNVKEAFVAYLYTEEPITYYQKAVQHIFVFGGKDTQDHQALLSLIARYIASNASYDEDSLHHYIQNNRL